MISLGAKEHQKSRGVNLCLGGAGLLVGAWLIGFKNINPISLQWLDADARHGQICFEYFYRSPMFQFPLTATPNLGAGWNTGLHQCAELGLIAFVLKPLARVFPDGFQFYGLWFSCSVALQLVISRKIFQQLKLCLLPQILGACLVTLSPTLLSRVGTLWHFQLASHWLILLAILMYFQRSSSLQWSLVTAFTLSVNVYLFVVVLVVAMSSLIEQATCDRHQKPFVTMTSDFLKRSSLILSCVVLAFVCLGFGTYLGASAPSGRGFFRTNVLAMINPSSEGYGFITGNLTFFESRQWIQEEKEGYGYLGLGALMGLPVLVFALVKEKMFAKMSLWPLLIAGGLSYVVALSNRVAVGGREFEIDVPPQLIALRQLFRAAPRFSWLLSYLIVIAAWWAIARVCDRYLSSLLAAMVLGAVLLIQIIDVGPGALDFRRSVSRLKGSYAPSLSSDWESLLETHNRVLIVPSVDALEDDAARSEDERRWFEDGRLLQIAWSTALRNHQINFGICSRPCERYAQRATNEARMELRSGRLTAGTVYAFSSESEWLAFAQLHGAEPLIVDGIRLLIGPSTDSEFNR